MLRTQKGYFRPILKCYIAKSLMVATLGILTTGCVGTANGQPSGNKSNDVKPLTVPTQCQNLQPREQCYRINIYPTTKPGSNGFTMQNETIDGVPTPNIKVERNGLTRIFWYIDNDAEAAEHGNAINRCAFRGRFSPTNDANDPWRVRNEWPSNDQPKNGAFPYGQKQLYQNAVPDDVMQIGVNNMNNRPNDVFDYEIKVRCTLPSGQPVDINFDPTLENEY